ncbi:MULTISPECIES: YraN family protein [Peptoniphilus]|uniref:UPF0102 protein HMPREF9225_1612 n=1 Tax=Peptoniphilus duerdenii ATCC BAA-1640 TaxID=862517 RepID=E0NN73_9FIRM|nr:MULTISPECIES: YraN family protein [Peptoniphilus]EFM24746.1 putative TIGR00252 family protein [Peptoniphilus duerdenii ATCC BAA-1640]ERT63104.1 TIGR00252 family protein [Peptoniphilus sp. BV3AC2]MDK8276604.1 YraN family protein [Peptoniphilus duerdenii]
MNTKVFGDIGEDIAAKFLEENGYNILERNYRGIGFEIDIICKSSTEIVFVEVKSRKNSSYGRPSEAVNKNKQSRIIRGAMKYIYDKKLQNIKVRFDVVEVYLDEKKIVHNKDAFILS